MSDRGLSVDSGVYVIWLELRQTKKITIGKLGSFEFPLGIYAYCGSAQRGLEARVMRHRQRNKRQHWHIDFLREHCHFLGFAAFSEEKRGECRLFRNLLSLPGAYYPIKGFGASDCSCPAHLVRIADIPYKGGTT